MANVRTNGKLVEISECIEDHRKEMYGIPAILWQTVNWQTPQWISHHLQITKEYCKEIFAVMRVEDNGEEIETMLEYERWVEKGKLVERLAPNHIIGLIDVKKYKETIWDENFPSDTYFFGRNLIESWGNTKEIAEWIRKDL